MSDQEPEYVTEVNRDGKPVPIITQDGYLPVPAVGTVGWLIGQLAQYPRDWRVTRYADEVVREVVHRCGKMDSGPNSEIDAAEDHVALW